MRVWWLSGASLRARIAPRVGPANRRAALGACAYPAIGAALLGAPAGLVWAAVAPRPELILTPIGAAYANPRAEAVIAGDGWFAVVSVGAGLLCGLMTYALGRRWLHGRAREIAVLVGLVGGGALGSFIAARVGRLADLATFQQQATALPAGRQVPGFLQLHATALLIGWPVAAVLAFAAALAVAGAARRRARPWWGWKSTRGSAATGSGSVSSS